MATLTEEKTLYLEQYEHFERELGDRDRPWLRRIRNAAIARFDALGFPGPRNEDWRFTNLAPLIKIPFQPSAGVDLDASELNRLAPAVPNAFRFVCVNGRSAWRLSALEGKPAGVIVTGLATQGMFPELVERHLARHAAYQDNALTALNTAFLQDGALVYVPKGVVVEQPIHLIFVSGANGEPVVSHPRSLIVLEPNSQVTIVEHYVGAGEDVCFTNAVTEIIAGENAVIDHYKLQEESREAFHIANMQVVQARSSNFSSHYIALGGALVRNEARVLLDGEGCETTLNGLYLGRDRQHLDNFTIIDHAKPHCASHELYKGILNDRAHGVFNGKIFVRQDAQKTDAKQTNQVLLLSEDAIINTKPQLEIFADDVKCTHGATVGQLDADALFYLRSRGIDRESARSLLTYAFANDILGRMKLPGLRDRLEQRIVTGPLPVSQDTL